MSIWREWGEDDGVDGEGRGGGSPFMGFDFPL